MLEILQYYTSSFGVWVGITVGMIVAGQTIMIIIKGK